MNPSLTPRQQQILDLVRRSIERTGAPPTRAEIAEILGFRSANSAEEHLQALARKGVIELVGGTSRGIRLKADQLRAPASQAPAPSEQMELPMPGLAQLPPLIGRVAAGQPILAQEHIEAQYGVSLSLFSAPPDYLLRVKRPKHAGRRHPGRRSPCGEARQARRATARSWWRGLAMRSP